MSLISFLYQIIAILRFFSNIDNLGFNLKRLFYNEFSNIEISIKIFSIFILKNPRAEN